MATDGPTVSASGTVTGMHTKKKHPKKKTMLITLLVVLVVGLGTTYSIVQYIGKGSLTEYSDANYSILLPSRGYTKEVTASQTAFVKRDSKGALTSGVFVIYQKFGVPLSDEAVTQMNDQRKKQATEIVTAMVRESYTPKKVAVMATINAGVNGNRVTADLEKNGQKVGRTIVTMLVSKDEAVTVGVVADKNSQVGHQIDTIVNSFTLASSRH